MHFYELATSENVYKLPRPGFIMQFSKKNVEVVQRNAKIIFSCDYNLRYWCFTASSRGRPIIGLADYRRRY